MSDTAEDGCPSHADRKVVVWSHRKVVWSREKHMKMVDDANLLPGEQGFISQYKSPYKPLNNRQVGVSIICDRLFHFSNAPYHHQKERGKWADKYWATNRNIFGSNTNSSLSNKGSRGMGEIQIQIQIQIQIPI